MKSTGKVTVKDIAKKLNVSLSTVNKALTGKPGISEIRRKEIIETAKQMGYEVNHVAQALSRKPINIGIIIPENWRDYFEPIENGMKNELLKLSQSNVNGEFVHISQSRDVLPAIKYFADKKADIIIYCPSLIAVDKYVTEFIQSDICPPVMLAGADCDSIKSVCTISIDSALSGKMAADLLSVFMGGKGNVAVLMGSSLIDTHVKKADEFTKKASALGLNVISVYETGDNPDVMAHCVKKALAETDSLDGIYVATGNVKSVVDCFEKNFPYIVATDVYEDLYNYMEQKKVSATIFQNQALMGKLSIENAYSYIVKKSSYSRNSIPLPSKIYVTPHLFLHSNLENFVQDDANNYRVEF